MICTYNYRNFWFFDYVSQLVFLVGWVSVLQCNRKEKNKWKRLLNIRSPLNTKRLALYHENMAPL